MFVSSGDDFDNHAEGVKTSGPQNLYIYMHQMDSNNSGDGLNGLVKIETISE